MKIRLQKLMADAGLGSRRHNENLIRAGRVSVNGQVAHLGDKADPATDIVAVDGQPLQSEATIYIMLYKPRGVLSSTEDEMAQGRQTVRDLVDLPGHLYPVGRLDKQSEGLMLLTNDGHLAHRLTHPRYEHEKVYRVTVEGQPSPETLQQWANGLLLDGQMTVPAGIEILAQHSDHTLLQITMREGRKRQIRRIAAQLGHPVQQLQRVQIGPLQLTELRPGEWRHLTKAEVAALQQAVQAPARQRPAPAAPPDTARK